MIPTLYRGSVKDLLGPHTVQGKSSIVFDYTDAFSVFDWGRMPDLLPRKGEALAVLAADFFEKLEKPETWKEFSKTSGALALRKANRFGAIFNELGEELQAEGLRTHYLGVLKNETQLISSSETLEPFRKFAVKPVSVVKPHLASVLGRVLPDYFPTRASEPPRLVPLEVIFRTECTEGSSLLERVSRDPAYLASLGFPHLKVEAGKKWDFPVLEFFTKLESTDRPVALSEALAISGLSAKSLQEVLLKTAWVSGLLRFWFSRLGLEVADGKLEWAVDAEGKCFLVDAIGPDELRILKNGIQLSKEFLRAYYRKTSWYMSVERAKSMAKNQGTHEWKKWVQESPPPLSHAFRELASQLYIALTNELSGKKWFLDAWSLEQVVGELKKLKEENLL